MFPVLKHERSRFLSRIRDPEAGPRAHSRSPSGPPASGWYNVEVDMHPLNDHIPVRGRPLPDIVLTGRDAVLRIREIRLGS